MLWLVIGIVLLVIAIAGGTIVHPILFVLGILAMLAFFSAGAAGVLRLSTAAPSRAARRRSASSSCAGPRGPSRVCARRARPVRRPRARAAAGGRARGRSRPRRRPARDDVHRLVRPGGPRGPRSRRPGRVARCGCSPPPPVMRTFDVTGLRGLLPVHGVEARVVRAGRRA